MKFNFTQLLAFLAFIFTTHLATGQVLNNISITAPAEIAGNYPTGQPDWGAQVDTFQGNATFGKDGVAPETNGCESPIENVSGKIAFLDRGACQFSLKALNAQNGGATAVVICNNEPGVEGFIGAAGTDAPSVTVPVFFVSYETCQKIRIVLEDGETPVEMGYYCGVPTYGDEVIWGDVTGQGDFEGGLNEWTVVNDATADSTWAWHDAPLQGAWGLGSPGGTACNGYMGFPSDFYDTNGVQGQNGAGPCPNGTSSFCAGSLFSPTIDLSGQTIDGLFVGVRHDVRYWINGSTALLVSYDDGVTWPDSIHMSSGVSAAGIGNTEIGNDPNCSVVSSPANSGVSGYMNIAIPSYTGQPSIKLQFRHLGAYYYASIDDVTLINRQYFDISVGRSFYAQAPARNIPISQVQEIPLHVDLNNTGNLNANDVTVEAQAFGPGGTLEATYTNDGYQVQPPNCFLNENLSFSDTHTPTTVGSHRIRYENVTDGDAFSENDTLSFPYNVVDGPWLSAQRPANNSGDARWDGAYRNLWTGLTSNDPANANFGGYDYAVAYSFYLPKGDGQYLNSVRFGMNSKAGNSGDVKVYLYLWNPTDASFPADRGAGQYTIAAADRILLGCMGQNTFGAFENNQPMNSILIAQQDPADMTVTMAVADPTTGQPKFDSDGNLTPLALQDDQMYALVFAVNTTQESELEMLSFASPDGSVHDLSGYNLAMDNLGKPYRAGTSVAPNLSNGGDFATELSSLDFPGYWGSNSAWIEMDISPGSIIGTEDISEELAASINVFPNPTSANLNIDINLSQVSSSVSFDLMNINGELVKTLTESNVKRGRFVMGVNELPDGVYTLNVRSEEGFTSKKVVITK